MKISILTSLIFVVLVTFSCRHHHSYNSISIDDGSVSLRIRYSGDIRFSPDSTTIEKISPFGYLQYKKNDKELFAESDEKGHLTLKLLDDGQSLVLNERGKKFVAEAVKEMISNGMNR